MKSDECYRKKIVDIGFVDPVRVNAQLLLDFPEETEDNLLGYLESQNYKNKILFPYNFG